MTDLSVVVLSYEARALLLRCLASVRREVEASPALSIETVVVDNGSCDGSVDAVREHFPEMRVLALPGNVGFAAGNNAGARLCRGRAVVLLNCDIELDPGCLAGGLAHLDAHPDVAVAGVALRHPDGRAQNSIHAFPSLLTELVPRFLLELLCPGRFPSKRRGLGGPTDVDAVKGAVFFVRRSVFEALGGLPEVYFFFLEETDFCFAVHEAGYRVVHLPALTALHDSGATSKRRSPVATRIEFHRSLYLFLRRRRGPATARLVRWIRTLRGGLLVVALGLASPFSSSSRRRLGERGALLMWHLRGCPPGSGLGPGARAGEPGPTSGKPSSTRTATGDVMGGIEG